MANDFLAKLFEHNNWANTQIMEACASLTEEQLDAEPHSATKGNIRETLVHFVTSQRGYLALLTMPVDARPRDPIPFGNLQDSLKASGEALLALVSDPEHKIPQSPRETMDGYYVEPWVLLVQVINHATEHREQIKSMLTALGKTPPAIDGWDYAEFTGAMLPKSK